VAEEIKLNHKDYQAVHAIVCEKQAIKEMMESLKMQLAKSISQEEQWWIKMIDKHDLKTSDYLYSVNHAQGKLIGKPKVKPDATNVTPINR